MSETAIRARKETDTERLTQQAEAHRKRGLPGDISWAITYESLVRSIRDGTIRDMASRYRASD